MMAAMPALVAACAPYLLNSCPNIEVSATDIALDNSAVAAGMPCWISADFNAVPTSPPFMAVLMAV